MTDGHRQNIKCTLETFVALENDIIPSLEGNDEDLTKPSTHSNLT